MLTLRIARRFSVASTFASPKPTNKVSVSLPVPKNPPNFSNVDEPALFKLKKERDPEKLFNLFKSNAGNKVVVENRFAFEDTVARLAGAGRFDYIESLLEQQKALPQGRREGFVIRIIMLYGKAGMSRHAINTFFDMHLYGCRRGVKSFNATLMVLTKSRDVSAIESFLRDVPMKFDITIDVMSLNIVVNTFCEMLVLDKAYMLMIEAEKFGLCPDVVTYTTLISAFYKARKWEFANGLWNLMVLKGCSPNLATFNVRIQFLVDRGRAWEANELMALMHKTKVTPDEITYNLVIKAFFRARRPDMVERVCSDFYRRGYKPNEKIYQTIIHYHCKAGDYDLAFTKCQESMKSNHFPSLHLITGEEDENDDDDSETANQSQLPLVVKISKNNGPCLEFGVTAFPDEISIDSLSIKDPNAGEDQIAYEGPDFGDLDENLQKAFHKYLDIRGINPRATNFLHEYMVNKDGREYVEWLKNVKKFVEA